MKQNIQSALLCFCLAFVLGHAPLSAEKFDPAKIPDLPVVDQNGQSRKFFTDLIKGKIVAINFAYSTCQSVCPLQLSRFVQLQSLLANRLGKDVFFLTLTLDPVNDTPAKLREWAGRYNPKVGWSFLSGDPANVNSILRAFVPPQIRSDSHQQPTMVVINEPATQIKTDFALEPPNYLAQYITTWKIVAQTSGASSQTR